MDLTSNQPTRRPLSPWTRAVFFFAGVLLPLICFLLAIVPFNFSGTWQSGNLNDIVCYLLTTPAALPFYPLLLYAMICMTAALFHQPSTQRFAVRLGIYTAVLPALQYMFVLTIAVTDQARFDAELVFIVAIVGLWAWGAGVIIWTTVRWPLPWLLRRLPGAWRRVRGSWIFIVEWFALITVTLIALAANFGIVAELMGEFLGMCFFIAIFGPLAAAPYWAFAAYGFMSVRVYWQYSRLNQFTLGQALGALTWVAAYLAAWRWGLRLALEQYARLPTEPPGGCYVCSAAAKGHAWWVSAELVGHSDSTNYHVNNQMRYLKCTEIMLKQTAPRLHELARYIYDRVGPRLAARMVHPLLADLAYAACKPAEWLARAVMMVAVPQSYQLVERIYAPRDHYSATSEAAHGRSMI